MALVEKKGSGNSGENPGGNTQSQGGGGPLELIIKTKEDRTIQVQIPKPIAKLEIMAKEDKGGKEGGQEGQQEGQAPLNLKIETIEGQVTEMEIPGEIAGLELKQQK